MIYEVKVAAKNYRLELKPADTDRSSARWLCQVEGRETQIDVARIDDSTLSLLIAGVSYTVHRDSSAQGIRIWIGKTGWDVELQDPRSWRGRRKLLDQETGPTKLFASMPGKVVRVLVREDDEVRAGEGILVVEAMKMQNEIKAPRTGVARQILVTEGTNVNAGDVLAIIE